MNMIFLISLILFSPFLYVEDEKSLIHESLILYRNFLIMTRGIFYEQIVNILDKRMKKSYCSI